MDCSRGMTISSKPLKFSFLKSSGSYTLNLSFTSISGGMTVSKLPSPVIFILTVIGSPIFTLVGEALTSKLKLPTEPLKLEGFPAAGRGSIEMGTFSDSTSSGYISYPPKKPAKSSSSKSPLKPLKDILFFFWTMTLHLALAGSSVKLPALLAYT